MLAAIYSKNPLEDVNLLNTALCGMSQHPAWTGAEPPFHYNRAAFIWPAAEHQNCECAAEGWHHIHCSAAGGGERQLL